MTEQKKPPARNRARGECDRICRLSWSRSLPASRDRLKGRRRLSTISFKNSAPAAVRSIVLPAWTGLVGRSPTRPVGRVGDPGVTQLPAGLPPFREPEAHGETSEAGEEPERSPTGFLRFTVRLVVDAFRRQHSNRGCGRFRRGTKRLRGAGSLKGRHQCLPLIEEPCPHNQESNAQQQVLDYRRRGGRLIDIEQSTGTGRWQRCDTRCWGCSAHGRRSRCPPRGGRCIARRRSFGATRGVARRTLHDLRRCLHRLGSCHSRDRRRRRRRRPHHCGCWRRRLWCGRQHGACRRRGRGRRHSHDRNGPRRDHSHRRRRLQRWCSNDGRNRWRR